MERPICAYEPCSKPIPETRNILRAKYCSRTCMDKACYERQTKNRRANRRVLKKRPCIVCGEMFMPDTFQTKICSKECRKVAYRKSKKKHDEKTRQLRNCVDCGTGFIPEFGGSLYCPECKSDKIAKGWTIRTPREKTFHDFRLQICMRQGRGGQCKNFSQCSDTVLEYPDGRMFLYNQNGNQDCWEEPDHQPLSTIGSSFSFACDNSRF